MEKIFIADTHTVGIVDHNSMAVTYCKNETFKNREYYKTWEALITDKTDYTVIQKLDDDFGGILIKKIRGALVNTDHVIKVTTASIK